MNKTPATYSFRDTGTLNDLLSEQVTLWTVCEAFTVIIFCFGVLAHSLATFPWS